MNKLMAGIDLHSNNVMIGLVDQTGKRLKHQKLDCDLEAILRFLKPYQRRLQTIAVESTFNWYWLVDGLALHGYHVVLANPAKIEQYSGLKHADDKSDAFFLAELLRLNILPTGHIYDAELRPVRDLLRRRMSLVQQRTALLLSAKSLHARTTGRPISLERLRTLEVDDVRDLYEHPANQLITSLQLDQIRHLDQTIDQLEHAVRLCARELPAFKRLQTLPGVGDILGLTIVMEVGDPARFPTPEDFASYCRTVDAKHLSNGKKKDEHNRKCGNRYLGWAMIEAANFAPRYDEHCRRWYDRKAAKAGKIIARKALACKLAKAAWHILREDVNYDPARMFPDLAMKKAS